ncbi:MAG TPA: hypothetical protein VGI46_11495 [Candidatus Acidoferrum sp.]|jgi:hypothetical protein
MNRTTNSAASRDERRAVTAEVTRKLPQSAREALRDGVEVDIREFVPSA